MEKSQEMDVWTALQVENRLHEEGQQSMEHFLRTGMVWFGLTVYEGASLCLMQDSTLAVIGMGRLLLVSDRLASTSLVEVHY